MDNHYYDEDGFYSFSLPATDGTEPPDNAVRIALPETGEHERAKLDNGTWVVVPYFKGVTYWSMDGSRVTIEDSNTLPPENVLFVGPPDERYKLHNGSEWLFDVVGERMKLIDSVDKYRQSRDDVPFEFPSESGIFYQKGNAINDTIQMASIHDTRDDDPIPTNGGMWNNHDGTVSRPFTLGLLKELFLAGYAIGEHNYAVQITHKTNINALSTPEAFENYEVTSGGWK